MELDKGGWTRIMFPALCDNCGAFFNSGYGVEFDIPVEGHYPFEGHVKCINCGGQARLRDDLFAFASDSFQELKKLEKPELIILKQSLVNILNRRFQLEDYFRFQKEAKEKVQEIKSLKDFWPKTRNEAYAAIGLLLVIIGMVINGLSGPKPDSQINNYSTYISDTVIETYYKENPTVIPPAPKIKDKPSKNQPCPCGSGKLYKRCHGLKTGK